MAQTGRVLGVALAYGVAAVHLLLVATMLSGGLLAWRWPRVILVHAPLAAALLAVNLVGADCPLTTLELYLRELGGAQPYTGGFVAHYLVEPVHRAGITPGVRVAMYVIAIVPNVVAYTVLCWRLIARRAGARPLAA